MQRTPEQEAAQEALGKLVRQCMAGDQQAWQQLVVSQHRRIYAICYRFTGSAADAEDLTQDVFLKLYRNLASFDTHKGSFQTWITTLARNLLVDHFRRTRAGPRHRLAGRQLHERRRRRYAGRPAGRSRGRRRRRTRPGWS